MKKLGSDAQPLLLDFEPTKTTQKLVFGEPYIVCDMPNSFSNLASQQSGHKAEAWASLCVDDYSNMWFVFGLFNSSWSFTHMGWPKVPRVRVRPYFYTKQHSYRFESVGESKTWGWEALLPPTSWSSLLKTLYSKRIIPRFPAVVTVNNPFQTNSEFPIGALDVTVEAAIPTYSEFLLFLKKLNLL